MTRGALDQWLTRHRRPALMGLDALAWTLMIAFFAAVRYMDVSSGVPWPRVLAAVAIAVGLTWAIGSLLWVYEVRNPVGSRADAMAVTKAVMLAGAALWAVSMAFPGDRLLPVWLPIAASAGTAAMAVGVRSGWRSLHETAIRPRSAVPALVLGAGNAGSQLVAQMLADPDSPFLPVGLIDDDPQKRHLHVQGIPMLGNRTDLTNAVERTGAKVLIISIPSAPSALFRDVSEAARELGLKVLVLPTLHEILNGRVGLHDLRDIDITDVLGREPVSTDAAESAGYVKGRRVLVTGAGGSIGSELCRQLASYQPEALYLLDRDESALQSLQLSLSGHGLLDTDDVILCDIRDDEALTAVFERVRPQVVFHAAALKHLPMLERYPEEAWKTNVLGTANVLSASRQPDVEVFVNISTDKAADPTSVLGYSKRIAERLTAAVAREAPGKYVSVRFGNVLGSRGSVLPAFAEQIEAGGPITVTHPDVTRYFMMIPEACDLVTQAAALGEDGEVLILEMGQPVRILDVAQQMIRMSGRTGVQITFTGLRPGEKLHEDLFARTEEPRSTAHELITAAPVPPLDIATVRQSAVAWGEGESATLGFPAG